MQFTPMSEDELARSQLLEPGTYPFEVMGASEEISKAGNQMIKLKLNVFGPDGNSAHVYDYLMHHNEKVKYKFRNFCEATGQLAKYRTGTLSELDCEGKAGFVKIKVDPANGPYQAKNSVVDYVKPADTPAGPQESAPRKLTPEEFNQKHGIDPKAELNDDLDIPF